MAKPKFPKKANGAKEAISSNSTPPLDTSITPAEAVALSGAEPAKSETKAEGRRTEPRKTVRKPEIVRTDSRATLVPINLEDEIRRLAYLLSERRGFEPGHESEDWLIAESEVLQRYRQHSA